MPTPWFRRTDTLLDEVDAYMAAWAVRQTDPEVRREIASAADRSLVRLIFESNTMEGAGPASEDGTRSVLVRSLGSTPEARLPASTPSDAWAPSHEGRVSLDADDLSPIAEALRGMRRDGLAPCALSFGHATRTDREVLAHLDALAQAQRLVVDQTRLRWMEIHFQRLSRRILTGALSESSARAEWRLAWDEEPFAAPRPLLFDGQDVVDLHRMLATSLLPDGDDGPGRLRSRPVYFGRDLEGVAPENLPRAMEVFVRRANESDTTFGGSVRKAAWVAHRFVEIHPFVDFNGRMSRILLNMVLWSAGIPFAVALRGGPAHKKRYLTALHRADRGDLAPFAALIADDILQTFRRVERRLVDVLDRPALVRPGGEPT